jgi:hypothetical protein
VTGATDVPNDLGSLARRGAARFLMRLLATLCIAGPLLAGPGEKPEKKDEAAKVAKKVEKALVAAQQAQEEREGLREFQEKVAEYAVLHARQLVKLRSRGASVAEQGALAHAIAAKREKARPGDIFLPEVQPLFRRLIAAQLEGPDTLDARKAVLEGNPGQEEEEDAVSVVVQVNAVYASGAPRSTVPPSVLLTLPRLPPALEYRFVGRDLLLIDSVAQIIVDFLPAVAPDPAIRGHP